MTSQILHQVFHLNNQGAALLCSPDLNQTKLALTYFNKALSLAATFADDEKSTVNCHDSTMLRYTGVWDLCLFSPVSIPSSSGDNSLYFFDQSICLRSEIFAEHMGCNAKNTIEFFSAIALMNTALAFHMLAQACLVQGYDSKAHKLFQKSLHLYETVVGFLTDFNSFKGSNSKAALFFRLAALNNASWQYLETGFQSKCQLAQTHMMSHVGRGAGYLPIDAIAFVEEIFLNTTILSMTGLMSTLPAAAA